MSAPCLEAVHAYFLNRPANERPLYEAFARQLDREALGFAANVCDFALAYQEEERDDYAWTTARFAYRGRWVEIGVPKWNATAKEPEAQTTLLPANGTWEVYDYKSSDAEVFNIIEPSATCLAQKELRQGLVSEQVLASQLLQWLRKHVSPCLDAVHAYFLNRPANVLPLYEAFAQALDGATPTSDVRDFAMTFQYEERDDYDWTDMRFAFRGRLVEIGIPHQNQRAKEAEAEVTLLPPGGKWEIWDWRGLFDWTPEADEREAMHKNSVRQTLLASALLPWLQAQVPVPAS